MSLSPYHSLCQYYPGPCLLFWGDAPHFTIEGANTDYLQLIGRREEEIVGKRFSEFILEEMLPDQVASAWLEALDKIAAGESKVVFPGAKYPGRFSDGESGKRYWQTGFAPLCDPEGNVVSIIHTLTDVTDTVEEQKQYLTDEQKRYRALVENGSDGIVILDSTGKIKYVSSSIERILGYTEEEALKISLWEDIHPLDLEPAQLKMAECLSKPGVPVNGHTGRIRHKDGSWRWLEATVTNLLHDPVINGIVDNFRDITDRKNAEDALLESGNRFRALFDQVSNLAVQGYGVDGVVRFWNKASEALYGYTKEEAVGKKLTDLLFPEETRDAAAQATREMILNGTRYPAEELELVRKDGGRVQVYSNYTVLRLPGLDPELFCIDIDLSELKKIEEELRISEEKYRTLFQFSPLPKWIYDQETSELIDVNQTAIEKYGFSREEFLAGPVQTDGSGKGPGVPMLVIPDKVEERGDFIHFGVVTFYKKNGTPVKVEVLGQRFPVRGKACIMVVSVDVTDRETALQQLKENEAKLLNAQKIAKIGYWQAHLTSNVLYWSDEVYAIWGIEREGFILSFEFFLESIHPDDRDLFFSVRARVLAGEGDLDLVHRIVLPSGSVKWVHEKGALIRGEANEPLLLEGTVQDITESKVAQERLLVSEARHRGIVESQTNYVIRTDLTGKYRFFNDKYRADFGWLYPENTMMGGDFSASVIDYDIPKLVAAISQCVAAPSKVVQIELDKPGKEGGVRTTLWDFVCITDSYFNLSELQCVGIDISDRKMVEDALMQTNMRYEYVLQATSDAIWDWDLTTNHVYWGPGFQSRFGFQLIDSKIDNDFWIDNIHPEDRDRIVSGTHAALDGNAESWIGEYRFRKADGTYAIVLDKAIVIRDRSGHATRMVGALQDITKQKKEEIQKNLLNEISRAFTGTIALGESLQVVLKRLMEFMDFMLAEIWLISTDQKSIRLAARYADTEATRIFYGASSSFTKGTKGVGLPGATWESRSVQVWTDLTRNKKFIRRNAAEKSGLEAGYGLPLIYNDEMVGVLVLGVHKEGVEFSGVNSLTETITPHLSAEIKRKQLEDILNQVFSFAPDVICIMGRDGFFKKINPAACELLEYTEDELLANPLTHFLHPDDVSKTVFEISAFNERQSTIYFENRCLTKSGKTKWLAWTSTPAPEEELVFAVAKDITEKKVLEDLLAKAINMAVIGSWEVDLVKKSGYWSATTKEILEVTEDFVPGYDALINFCKPGESQDLIVKAAMEAIEKGTSWDVEIQVVTLTGKDRWVRINGQPEFINSQCVRLFGSCQDIDERKRAQLFSIRTLEEKNTILESIDDAFFAVSRNWEVTYWNYRAEKILGVPKSEILGRNLWDIFQDAIGTESYVNYFKALEDNKVQHFETYYDTLEIWFEVSVYPSEMGLSVYFKDITERKLSEIRLSELNEHLMRQSRELAFSNAELEQFAYVASHDLQEPLRMVTSFLALLEKKYENLLDEKGKKYVYYAVDGAKRMRQIILDLLEFSRVGRTEDDYQPVDLNELIQEIRLLYKQKIEDAHAIIEVKKLPILESYRTPLRQVFQNLISNALKYAVQDVPVLIRIEAVELEDYWQFSVADNGIGINEQYFDKIFVLFQRLHSREQYSGTGMGLAITKKIVENLGGKIWLESTEGKGTTFYFTVARSKP